ncbi:MAG: DUF3006 domain-containing protein, partial [Chloroflexota bacterium]
MERAVIDRIDEGQAVLLVGDEERQVVVPLAKLPTGVAPGDWLKVTLDRGELVEAVPDARETARRRARIQVKM